jgi:hypothetical protein
MRSTCDHASRLGHEHLVGSDLNLEKRERGLVFDYVLWHPSSSATGDDRGATAPCSGAGWVV